MNITRPASKLSRSETVANRVRERRLQHGLSQQDLARKAGVTRQALYAIESNLYTPSTEVALKLARELNCSVDDLFTLCEDGRILEADYVGSSSGVLPQTRAKLAYVGNRLVARPVSDLGELLNFVIPADGLIVDRLGPQTKTPPRRVRVQLLKDIEAIKEAILVAGCDPAIHLAGEYFRKERGPASVVGWTMGSAAALDALQRGDVHIAGLHVIDYRSGECNLPFLRQHLRNPDHTVVRFAAWEEGLLLAPGNPKHIRTIADLTNPRIRFVNREPGSGARRLLDHALAQAGIRPEDLKGYERLARSHLEVGRLVHEGRAHAGIGTQAVARYFNLQFLPLQTEFYDLVIPTSLLQTHPSLSGFLSTLASRRFRSEIQALGGYDTTETGKIVDWHSPRNNQDSQKTSPSSSNRSERTARANRPRPR